MLVKLKCVLFIQLLLNGRLTELISYRTSHHSSITITYAFIVRIVFSNTSEHVSGIEKLRLNIVQQITTFTFHNCIRYNIQDELCATLGK